MKKIDCYEKIDIIKLLEVPMRYGYMVDIRTTKFQKAPRKATDCKTLSLTKVQMRTYANVDIIHCLKIDCRTHAF